ncbi:MSC domain-containing protein [Mycena kentingensis (nom. inval.)]|nr:MSC domain-containing protein [Mycena kentingensis (nom. inval.)]
MSRLTATEIVKKGEYLNDDFDPASLTVTQLLGVFGYHGVTYPTPYSKPRLVSLFNDQIKPRATKLRKERLKTASSIASDDGITDGVTGEPLSQQPPPPVRRSSRRLSRAPTEEPEPQPEPPKRRRSSAQPNLGGTSRKAKATQPALVEESEPEEEEMPARKVVRKKTLQTAGEQSRRVSHNEEDSAWEDNNVFQSGAESSSPARPPKPRKSLGTKKNRKSVSAPPEVQPSSSPPRPRQMSPFSPPHSRFAPELPANVAREMRLMAPKLPALPIRVKAEEDDMFDNGESDYAGDGPTEELGVLEEEVEVEEEVDDEAEDYNAVVARKIAEGGVYRSATNTSTAGKISRLILLLLSIASSAVVWNYKSESAPIGYCDMNRPTNAALERFRATRMEVDACNQRENRTDCPLPFIPFIPHADACTPCPPHAKCSQFNMTCDTGYLLQPHTWLFFLPSATPEPIWKLVSSLTDGLPGLGSVGLPPRCVQDRRITGIGVSAKRELALARGRRLCANSRESRTIVPDSEGGEARRWGYDMKQLAERVNAKIPKVCLFFSADGCEDTNFGKDKAPRNFGELFTEAIQQLSKFDEIVIGEDVKTKQRFVASTTPSLTWDCKIIVQSRAVWEEWRAMVYGAIALVLSGIGARVLRAQKNAEAVRIAGLVQTALDTLRAQDRSYHADPLSASVPYLSSLQLRDVVLAEEHSVSKRARLWSRVEKVVEENTNVRANLEEVDGGDEMRVWRWVGASSP